MTKSPWRVIAVVCLGLAGFSVVAAMYALSLRDKNPTQGDYIGYWAAARQLALHADPYDDAAVLRIERAEGYIGNQPRITPSPPVALLLVLPVGFFSAKTGLFLWTMAILLSLAISLRVLWLLLGRPDTLLPLLGFVFAPVVACLRAGQLGVFFLLSVVLFLYWIRTRPALAGAALLPLLLKPHLFLPFALVLLLWIFACKAYSVLAGALALALACSAATLFFDPQVWPHYFAMLRTSSLQDRFTPTISVALRLLIASNAEWPRFVLLGAACIWAVWYFRTRRAQWDWMHHGLMVLLVSLLCSPYSWFTDESLLLPALFVAVFRAQRAGRPAWPIALVAGIALVEIVTSVDLKTWYYVWTPAAWLACFLYATWNTGAETENPRHAAATA